MKKSPELLNLLKTIGYYLVVAIVICGINFFAGEPKGHFPFKLGTIVLIFVAPVFSVLLLIRNIYLIVIKRKTEHIPSLFAHLAMLFAFLIVVND